MNGISQTNGAGVDHIVEVGGEDTLLKSLNAVKFGGTIHLVGIIASVRPPLRAKKVELT